MTHRAIDLQKLESQWQSLSIEQRTPHDSEIVLVFTPNEIRMGIAAQGTTFLPLRYNTDEAGLSLLLQQLHAAGIQLGGPDDYLIDETAGDETAEPMVSGTDSMEGAVDDEAGPAYADDQTRSETTRIPPEASAASVVGKTLLNTAAIVGAVYIAYRMIRRPSVGPVRFS